MMASGPSALRGGVGPGAKPSLEMHAVEPEAGDEAGHGR